MDLGKVKVTIEAENNASKELSKVKGELQQLDNSTGKYSASIGKIGKIADKTAKVTAGAIAYITKKAIDSYSSYEQLSGGVEKLFGDSAGIVYDYADKAYKTAGMSANKYMENITSFSASLINSLGGNTKLAAQMGDMAIRDMSDNINVFGSNAQDVENAYKGFAKQNFTMLDNLKLGYGGTKTEMERLLADAEELTGKKYDVSNFADIVEAIHAVQQEMNITGTTAKESANTIEGSVNTMKSAWDNWLTALGSGSAEQIQETTDALVKSMKNVGKNIVPVIGNVLKSMKPLVGLFGGAMFVKLASKVLLAENAFKSFQVANEGMSIAQGVLQGKLSATEGIFGALGNKINATSTVMKALPWAGAVAGATLVAFAIKEAWDSTHKYRQEVDELAKSNQESVSAIEANYDAVDFYLGRIDELMAKDKRTAEEKRLLAQYCNQVNEAIGENVVSYDSEKDALNESTSAVRENIQAKKEMALANAYASNYEASLQKQVELEKDLAGAQEELASAQAQYDKEAQSGFVSQQTSQNLQAQKANVKDLEGAYRKAGDEAEYWGNKMDEASGKADKATKEPKTVKVKADTKPAEDDIKKLDKTEPKPKVSKVQADAKAAYKEYKKVNSTPIQPKTAKVNGDNKDAIDKVEAVNKKDVHNKKTTITANDKASDVIDDVNNKSVHNKSFSISATLTGLSAKVKSFLGLRRGTREIPYDGFVAELHKGERVLTAPEVNQYDRIMRSINEKAINARQKEQVQAITNNAGTNYSIHIDGTRINDDAQIENMFGNLMFEMARRGLM